MVEPEKPDDDWEKKQWDFYFFLLFFGLIGVVPMMVVRFIGGNCWAAIRLVCGLPGWLFGAPWFATYKHLVWKTNFLAMPPDDAELARWFAAQVGVVRSEVRREPYWIVFDCTLRGYFLRPKALQDASTEKAKSLGYDTGGRISIIDIEE